jgi:hypothetical protein
MPGCLAVVREGGEWSRTHGLGRTRGAGCAGKGMRGYTGHLGEELNASLLLAYLLSWAVASQEGNNPEPGSYGQISDGCCNGQLKPCTRNVFCQKQYGDSLKAA